MENDSAVKIQCEFCRNTSMIVTTNNITGTGNIKRNDAFKITDTELCCKSCGATCTVSTSWTNTKANTERGSEIMNKNFITEIRSITANKQEETRALLQVNMLNEVEKQIRQAAIKGSNSLMFKWNTLVDDTVWNNLKKELLNHGFEVKYEHVMQNTMDRMSFEQQYLNITW